MLKQTLPGFTLPLIGGGQISDSRILENRKGAVVIFWSGVCSHCTRYDAWLNAFASNHRDIGILAIACRQGESLHQIEATMRQRNLRFPIAFDADRAVAAAFFVQQTPRAFFMDSQWRLLYRGAIDNFKYPQDRSYVPYLEEAIRDFSAGKIISRPETPGFGCAIESAYYQLPTPIRP